MLARAEPSSTTRWGPGNSRKTPTSIVTSSTHSRRKVGPTTAGALGYREDRGQLGEHRRQVAHGSSRLEDVRERAVGEPLAQRVDVDAPVDPDQPADPCQRDAEAQLDAGEPRGQHHEERVALPAPGEPRVQQREAPHGDLAEQHCDRAGVTSARRLEDERAAALDRSRLDRQLGPSRGRRRHVEVERSQVARAGHAVQSQAEPRRRPASPAPCARLR